MAREHSEGLAELQEVRRKLRGTVLTVGLFSMFMNLLMLTGPLFMLQTYDRVLSARSEEVDKVRGLETGADDYVIKPYSMVELMARARAQIRRVRPSTVGVTLEYGDIRLDPEAHRVYRGDKVLKLGPTEFRLLSAFMEKPGRVWSREHLLDRVWGRDIYVDTRTVDVHIGRLRKALMAMGGDDPLRELGRIGVRLPARIVMDVVELPHRRVPGLDHLHGPALVVEPFGERVEPPQSVDASKGQSTLNPGLSGQP